MTNTLTQSRIYGVDVDRQRSIWIAYDRHFKPIYSAYACGMCVIDIATLDDAQLALDAHTCEKCS